MIEYKVGQVVRHFKADFNRPEEERRMKYYYVITALPFDVERGIFTVVYRALYDNHDEYVRTLSDFSSYVDKNKYPEAKQIHRFEVVA